MHKFSFAVLLLVPLSCTKVSAEQDIPLKDFASEQFSTILCEEDFETCGVQGFTEWGVPILLVSEKVSDYFAPYGLLMWELPPPVMAKIWNTIEEYELEIAWVGVVPLEKVSVPMLTERVELRKERRAWIKRVAGPVYQTPEKWLRLPEKPKKPEPQKKG